MKTSRRVLLTLLLIVSIILSICLNTYAADEKGTVTLTDVGKGKYKVGDEFSINVSLAVSGFDGVIEFLAGVEYDHDVLEYIEVVPETGWRVLDSADKIYVERSRNDDASGLIGKLTFKVKKAIDKTTIKLLNIDASGNTGSILWLFENVNEPSITIGPLFDADANIPDDPSNPDDINNTIPDGNNINGDNNGGSANGGNTNGGNANGGNTNTNKKPSNKDNTTATNKIPQTGYFNIGIILVSVGIVVIAVLFFRYKKIEKEIK